MHKLDRPDFFVLAALLLLPTPGAIAADADPLAAYLAGECWSCHQPDGSDDGIPSIVGWEEHAFVTAMGAYRSGERGNLIMRAVASSVSEDETAALAGFLGKLDPGGNSR